MAYPLIVHRDKAPLFIIVNVDDNIFATTVQITNKQN
ncbi:hypothetical protein electrica_01890 [Klebsiella electrica]|nr:hypothetical protein electrica_01890 [Klebsiella electrica]